MTMADLRTQAGMWDELIDDNGEPRAAAAAVVQQLQELGLSELQQRQDLAELDIVGMGITFTVYSDGRGIDRAQELDDRAHGAEHIAHARTRAAGAGRSAGCAHGGAPY